MIARTFINRPVTAIVISIILLILGIVALYILPVAQYPDITPPTASVQATFLGADAETLEQTTTTALENQINGTPGMTYMTSASSASGVATVIVNFEIGTNIDIAALDVQNRINTALPSLPEQVRRLGVTVRKRNPSIMMVLAFYAPDKTHNSTFIGNYANIVIKDALLRVPGVGDVFAVADEFSMRVWLYPQKMAQLGLTVAEVQAAIQEQNLQISGGRTGAPPHPEEQAFEYTILPNSRLKSPQDFEQIIVRTDPEDNRLIRLKDVAKVQLDRFDYSSSALVNGQPGALILIYQTPEANTFETYNKVLALMEEMRPEFPKDIDFVIPSESATVISISIQEVIHTFIEALILVVLVVFLFLQNVRATLIPVLAIPVSLIGTFIFFIPLGFTINTLTMFAFVLAIGIVVDDAIVVVEAVQHHIQRGLSVRVATLQAMKDISAPVIAIALILAAVFVPVGFIPGISGKLYQQFAITIAVSVLISAFVALSLTPALCILLLKPKRDKNSRRLSDRFFIWFNGFFECITRRYTHSVRAGIRRTSLVLVMMVVMVVGLVYLFKHKATAFIPYEDEGKFFISYELPEGAATARSRALMEQMMTDIKQLPYVQATGGIVSLNIANFSSKSNSGTIFVKLKPWAERTKKEEQFEAIIQQVSVLLSKYKEAVVYAIPPPPLPGVGTGTGFEVQLQQKVSQDNIQQFEGVAERFIRQLNQRSEIASAFTFFKAATPAYQVDVDRDKVKRLGIDMTSVYATMSALLGGQYVNDFNLYGRNFKVVMMADAGARQTIDDLGQYYVRNYKNDMVPLSALASVKVVEKPAAIVHYNGFRAIDIHGLPAAGYSSGQVIEVVKDITREVLPMGYGYSFSGLSLEEIKAGNWTIYIFMASIVFVFLFLAALYESWLVPFSVFFAFPVALLGSMLTLYFLPALSNNIYAQIGMLTLIGLSAKNAILIVAFAKERTDQGMPVIAATLEAVSLRLRPIVMTSMAFILGVTPLMFATGAAAAARTTLGWTVFGGMLAATSLAIFVVPVMFALIVKYSRLRTDREE